MLPLERLTRRYRPIDKGRPNAAPILKGGHSFGDDYRREHTWPPGRRTMSKTIATKAAKGKSAGGKTVAKAATWAQGGKAPAAKGAVVKK
jgi:hypothetical protein